MKKELENPVIYGDEFIMSVRLDLAIFSTVMAAEAYDAKRKHELKQSYAAYLEERSNPYLMNTYLASIFSNHAQVDFVRQAKERRQEEESKDETGS